METKGKKGGSQHRENNQGEEFTPWLMSCTLKSGFGAWLLLVLHT